MIKLSLAGLIASIAIIGLVAYIFVPQLLR